MWSIRSGKHSYLGQSVNSQSPDRSPRCKEPGMTEYPLIGDQESHHNCSRDFSVMSVQKIKPKVRPRAYVRLLESDHQRVRFTHLISPPALDFWRLKGGDSQIYDDVRLLPDLV